MKFFKPWTWFQSEERALKLEQLKLEIEKARLGIEMMRMQLHMNQIPLNTQQSTAVVKDVPTEKPYKSLRLIDTTILLTLHDGSILSKDDVDMDFYDKVSNCSTEKQVITMFLPKIEQVISKEVEIETPEERQIVIDNFAVLRSNPDFTIIENKVYLSNISLEMPASVIGSFIEVQEKLLLAKAGKQDTEELEETYQALKMFWYWTALNPIEESRRDLLAFVKNRDITITKNGLLQMYRKIVSVSNEDNGLHEAIGLEYGKIKKWKKSPSSYHLYLTEEGNYVAKTHGQDKWQDKGNLQELYNELPNMGQNRYTDNHTHTKDIRIGQIYKEDEDKIDLNNQRDCSNGLHVGSHEFGFSGFGNTGVLALVNPSKVRSVPVSDTNKMRVSEMFIAAVMEIDEYKNTVLGGEVNDYSQEYFNASVEELEEAILDATFEEKFSCQDSKPVVTLMDITAIKDVLSAKVTMF